MLVTHGGRAASTGRMAPVPRYGVVHRRWWRGPDPEGQCWRPHGWAHRCSAGGWMARTRRTSCDRLFCASWSDRNAQGRSAGSCRPMHASHDALTPDAAL